MMFIILLTSLTGRLLEPRGAFRTSCTPFGRLQVDFGLTWGRPGRSFGPPWVALDAFWTTFASHGTASVAISRFWDDFVNPFDVIFEIV